MSHKPVFPTISVHKHLDSIIVSYGETFTIHFPGGHSLEARVTPSGAIEVFANVTVKRFDDWAPMRPDPNA